MNWFHNLETPNACLVSATFSHTTKILAKEIFGEMQNVIFNANETIVRQEIYKVRNADKILKVTEFLESYESSKSIIIFVNSREKCMATAAFLSLNFEISERFSISTLHDNRAVKNFILIQEVLKQK